jgi:hypothetical protein
MTILNENELWREIYSYGGVDGYVSLTLYHAVSCGKVLVENLSPFLTQSSQRREEFDKSRFSETYPNIILLETKYTTI